MGRHGGHGDNVPPPLCGSLEGLPSRVECLSLYGVLFQLCFVQMLHLCTPSGRVALVYRLLSTRL